MKIILWVVLTPVVLLLLGLGLYLLKAIVQGAFEGWRSAGNGDDDGSYRLPDEATALGMLPPNRQDTDNAAPVPAELAAAKAATLTNDWKSVAALFEAVGTDWERRYAYAEKLAGLAAVEDEWLIAWETERPDDPTAALLRARSTVVLAGRLRGSQRAKYTTSEQFDGFHRILSGTSELHARAAELAPDDPSPYISEISTALGLGYPHSDMDRVWSEITARDPHHFAAHWYALQYWCAKWRGSEQLARAFAAEAAAGAPLGSLLTVFPLIAHFEHHDDDSTTEADSTPEMIALVDACLADAAAAPADHPRLPEVRHLLAYYLSLQDRDAASVEQFRLVDGHVDALPWRYRADPAAAYCRLRDITLRQAAATT